MTLSPGVANSCFELLDLVSRRTLSFEEIKTSFGRIGVVPAATAIEMSQNLRWVRASDRGQAVPTHSGFRLMANESHRARLRQAILDYLDIEEPFWLQNAVFGRKKLLAFAGTPIAQLFLEAGLVDGTSHDVVAFWDALAARARGQRDDRLVAIGRDGERLTIAYEQERTGKAPKWIAVDSSEDGYDILSVLDRDSPLPLTIEVKATRMGMAGSFHLTRSEWDRAQHGAAHVFHLWDVGSRPPRLAVLSPSRMILHVPASQGSGEWELACIPFEVFAAHFAVRHIVRTGGLQAERLGR